VGISWLAHLSAWLLLPPFQALSQEVVSGTFKVVRSDEACQPITARIIPSSTGTSSECVRVAVADVQSLVPTIRYRPVFKNDVVNSSLASSELEVALGALIVHGSTTSAWNLTYKCPPPGYNGFSVESGSYCEVLPDTQVWATFTDTSTQRLRQVRVILSPSFPPIESLTPNAPPFGTALYDFPDGIDVALAAAGGNGTVLLICPDSDANSSSSAAVNCPRLPAPAQNLTARFSVQATGYFGSSSLDEAIPSVWNQDDNTALLTGMTTHSGSGGVQDVYVNASGFHLYGHDSDVAPPYCYWFGDCGYDCQVTALADSRFLDSLGTWNVTWRVEENSEVPIPAAGPQVVRAYIGNGMSPGIVYLNAGNGSSWTAPSTALVGIDKVGSTLATNPPSYAYYWYTNFTMGPPDAAVQETPATCFQSPGGAGGDDKAADDEGSATTPTSRADPPFRHRQMIAYATIALFLAMNS
jgi:hypothetical protein